MEASNVNARLEKLERENRRLKKIGIVSIVFVSVAIYRRSSQDGQGRRGKSISACGFCSKSTCPSVNGLQP